MRRGRRLFNHIVDISAPAHRAVLNGRSCSPPAFPLQRLSNNAWGGTVIPHFRALIWIVVALCALSGCGEKAPSASIGPVRQVRKSDMTEAEVKYGIAPVPDS